MTTTARSGLSASNCGKRSRPFVPAKRRSRKARSNACRPNAAKAASAEETAVTLHPMPSRHIARVARMFFSSSITSTSHVLVCGAGDERVIWLGPWGKIKPKDDFFSQASRGGKKAVFLRDLRFRNPSRHDDEAGVRNHTMLGTDGKIFHMPEAQEVLHHFNRRETSMGTQFINQGFHLHNRRHVTDQNATRPQSPGCVRQYPPGFRDINQQPIGVVRLNPFIGISQHERPVRRLAEEPGDI